MNSVDCIVGEQNLPPQNGSVGCILSHAENNEASDESEKHFDLSQNCLKNLESLFPEENYYQISAVNMGQMWLGESLRDQRPLCIPLPHVVQQTFFFFLTDLLFYLCQLPPYPLKSQPIILNILYFLQLNMVFK